MSLPDLSSLALPGATIQVRATPKARRNAVETGDPIRIWVTAPPDNGKANDAIRKLLAKSMGVAPTRLTLKRGATARGKVFQLD